MAVTEATATGRLHLLSENGDDPVLWDVKDQESVDAAFKALTEQLEKTGGAAYEVAADGQRTIIPRGTFPENAEKVVVIPALQGG